MDTCASTHHRKAVGLRLSEAEYELLREYAYLRRLSLARAAHDLVTSALEAIKTK